MPASASPFVWYELMTTDPAAAAAFYTKVIGWQAADSGMPGMDYTLLSAGPHQVAGLMALPPESAAGGARPAWLGYVSVDDVDAKAAELTKAGGVLHHPPADIPGIGRFAAVSDPHGAAFCLFKDNGMGEYKPPAPDTLGTVGWHELMAGELDAAWDFYSRMFGWTRTEAMDMGPMGTYQMFAVGGPNTGPNTGPTIGPTIGAMMTKPPEVPKASWLYYWHVAAIDAAAGRVKAGGGQVMNGPMEVPGGQWIVQCSDPQGAMFALVAPKR